MGRRVRCFLGCCLDRERRATGAKQEATKDGGSYERANGSEFKSWKQLKHAERSKSAHNEGMLRCVECSAEHSTQRNIPSLWADFERSACFSCFQLLNSDPFARS